LLRLVGDAWHGGAYLLGATLCRASVATVVYLVAMIVRDPSDRF
jgi:hypothetical protein